MRLLSLLRDPTSTAIFKCLLALKTRNAIIISPHPRAKGCTIEAAKVVKEAAEAAGAPKGLIGWIDVPSLELTNEVMKEADIILATGGPGMVKAAYSPGLSRHLALALEIHQLSLMILLILRWLCLPLFIPRHLIMV